ncbi:D-alanyl-D-alanine carboxypeptidase/D-alanyl-D-alanine-endopeptidase (penicillin-binding protein 4) [Motilibacter rhizosphaerae]|uniref:D-alanyl-D-alanine carboxypeptidase/D-alanyl-D-alanine-endopeptidase (Penicillin-binding protein 4) n=1 Tax=Motilibacter rhizosphaerae TaxID=598652 RepID=A0A4Q7NAB3_9ACTN|nr:D-alanyl-D-alanine carboxypeptidase/D-alanyl-D-alanine-endopeptidase [Motilibacter rhizosphaerae]RZS79424.1 D-alanyl-D-alanine carboxypeptidase/D-alanyl-D-alanine-endopeptidase (penicillin-binding protein 4) [Motilibacter rhizosphaerae]
MRRAAGVGAATLLVAAAAVGVTATSLHDPATGRSSAPGQSASPAPVLASPAPAVLPAEPADARPTAAGVSAALRSLLAAPALGTRPGAVVVGPDGAVLLDRDGSRARTPASTAKLLTAAAVLSALPPSTRLATRVVADAPTASPSAAPASAAAAGPARIVLVGGGDATLQSGAGSWRPEYPAADTTAYARLDVLAQRTAAALRGRTVELAVDDSAFRGPQVNPGWEPGYVRSGVVAPVSALSVDEGRVQPGSDVRAADPALDAGRRFAALLRRAGVVVDGTVRRAAAPSAGDEVARVESPPLSDLAERMLTQSDNDLAEALAALVQARTGAATPGAAVVAALHAAGVPTAGARLLDGSGLARSDAVPPRTLAAVLALALRPDRPALRPLLTGLPVAGGTGTLAARYTSTPDRAGRGSVRAKTGTLTGVSTLAGAVETRDAGVVVFAVMADRVPAPGTLAARAALDRVATALARCGCR